MESPGPAPEESGGSTPAGTRWGQAHARWVTWAGYLTTGIPIALYFWFIHDFGVNVPYADTWSGDVPLLGALVRGRLTLGLLWAPHNENRMLVANLVLVGLDLVTRMNAKVEMYVSAALLVAAFAGVCWLAATTARVSGIWLLPAAFVMFSLVQFENTLWAFQLAWMLIIFGTVWVLVLLELCRQRPLLFGLAVLLALAASYSSLQGLLVWPAGFVYALMLGLPRKVIAAWVGLGVVATAVYGWHFGTVEPATSKIYPLTHPVAAVHFFVDLVGATAGIHPGIMGVVVLGLIVAVGWVAVRSRLPLQRLRLPVALVLVGVLFDLMVTDGRMTFGLAYASTSRYTSYSLLLLMGVYLGAATLLTAPEVRSAWRELRPAQIQGLLVVGVCLATIGIQLAWVVPNDWYQGRVSYVSRNIAAGLIRSYQHEPAALIGEYLFTGEGEYIKSWCPLLEREHWSVFSS